MFRANHHVTTIVCNIVDEDSRTRRYELSDPDSWDLPPFTAGAHIDVHLSQGAVRQYSLCGSPTDRKRYQIAVQREDMGRGVSMRIHSEFKIGDTVSVSLPRNHFPLSPAATHHVMIAGGIGITPFLSMITSLQRGSATYELHYCTRSDSAFFGELSGATATNMRIYTSATGKRLNAHELLRSPSPSTHVYCCGPKRLIDDVAAATKLWLPSSIHFERFGGAEPAVGDNQAYKIRLARSNKTLDVLEGQSMLAAIREAGVEIEASCEAGVCLSCKTRYLDGTPRHRDILLKPSERKEFLTPCVSDGVGGVLVLDL